MEKQHEGINITSLPDDILGDIVSRLPTNTLLQCKTVCKQWHNLITHHPTLPQLHQNNTKNTNNIMAVIQILPFSSRLVTIDLQGKLSSSLLLIDYIHPNNKKTKKTKPFPQHIMYKVLASSHGLLLCTITRDKHNIVLNPITINYTLLPPMPAAFMRPYTALCLTFTPSSNNYTVFAFGTLPPHYNSICCQLFDSSTNAWRIGPSAPMLHGVRHYRFHKALYYHGSAYVLTSTISDGVANLLALDVTKEEWSRIPMPLDCVYYSSDMNIGITEFGGSDFALYKVQQNSFKIWRLLLVTEEWVLKEEVKCCSFWTVPLALSCSVFFFWDNYNKKLVAYDREHKTWKNIDLPYWDQEDPYTVAISCCYRTTIFSP